MRGDRVDAKRVSAGSVDRWDVSALLGCVLLFFGLCLWVSLGCALTVVGALFLLTSVAGARNAGVGAVPVDQIAERRTGRAA